MHHQNREYTVVAQNRAKCTTSQKCRGTRQCCTRGTHADRAHAVVSQLSIFHSGAISFKSHALRTAKGHSSPRLQFWVLLPRRSSESSGGVWFDVARDLLVLEHHLRKELKIPLAIS